MTKKKKGEVIIDGKDSWKMPDFSDAPLKKSCEKKVKNNNSKQNKRNKSL